MTKNLIGIAIEEDYSTIHLCILLYNRMFKIIFWNKILKKIQLYKYNPKEFKYFMYNDIIRFRWFLGLKINY